MKGSLQRQEDETLPSFLMLVKPQNRWDAFIRTDKDVDAKLSNPMVSALFFEDLLHRKTFVILDFPKCQNLAQHISIFYLKK